MGDNLELRQAQTDDIEGYLSLHHQVFESNQEVIDESWFQWMFSSVSELEDIPVVLALNEGEIVGAIGFWGLRFKTNRDEVLGIKPVEVMVLPEHRGMNTFNQLMSKGRQEIYPEDNWFEFGNPRDDTVDIWTKLQGWDVLNTRDRSFRIQHPTDYVKKPLNSSIAKALVGLGDLPFRAGLFFRDKMKINSPQNYNVAKYDNSPLKTLEQLYQENVPEKLHVVRDSSFYEDRLEPPHKDYITYVVEDESPSEAVIVSKSIKHDTINIIDVLPITLDNQKNTERLRSAMHTIIAEHKNSTAIQWSPALPQSFHSEFGFNISDHLSRIASSNNTPTAFSGLIPNSVIWGLRTRDLDSSLAHISDFNNWWMSGIEQEL